MSRHNTRSPEGSAADDKPAGSRLQTSVPTEAIKRPVHIGIEPVTGEIENSLYSNNLPRALALTSWILRNEIPVTPAAFVLFGEIFAVAVPNYPCPVVDQVVIEHRHLLDELIDLAEAHHFDDLLLALETLCYRLHEGCRDFVSARRRLLKMRRRNREPHACAQIISNYGYECLLENDFVRARRHFQKALLRFEQLQDDEEIANAQANLLICEFELRARDDTEALLPELLKTHNQMYGNNDWRVRKTMCMLARHAENRNRITVAIAWMRRAIKQCNRVETRLQDNDRQYLKRLCRKRNRRKRLALAHPGSQQSSHRECNWRGTNHE